tara:strand:+ start:3500 stop:3826 length:327 start_codon:yes stop_codon:yes gene_type:complete
MISARSSSENIGSEVADFVFEMKIMELPQELCDHVMRWRTKMMFKDRIDRFGELMDLIWEDTWMDDSKGSAWVMINRHCWLMTNVGATAAWERRVIHCFASLNEIDVD